MNTLTWTITILGFIATIVGSLLAIFTYVSPVFRLKHYLKRTKKWKKVYIDRIKYNWQYKNHPEFTIEIDDESNDWGTTESWMNYYPDSSKSASLVRVRANGQVLFIEEFISLDGGRYFVPLPKREIISESETDNYYYYTSIQVMLARIVSYYYRGNNIEDFISNHNLEIKDNKKEIKIWTTMKKLFGKITKKS